MNVLSDHRGPRNRPSSPRSHGGSSALAQTETFVWFGLQIVFSFLQSGCKSRRRPGVVESVAGCLHSKRSESSIRAPVLFVPSIQSRTH